MSDEEHIIMKQLLSSKLWVDSEFSVFDGSKQIFFHLQDCFNFHGYDAVGGVVLGFRLLQAAKRYLNNNQPFQRRQLSLYTAFPGLGARDVFELITRMCSEQRFKLYENHRHSDAEKGVAGSFYFEFAYQGRSIQLAPPSRVLSVKISLQPAKPASNLMLTT